LVRSVKSNLMGHLTFWLGTFGCVPAFDTYFKKGVGISTFGPRALRKVGQFYSANAEVIDS